MLIKFRQAQIINTEFMEEALEKLKKIFVLISEKDKKKLQTELAKMMPVDSNARVTTKIGWGHFNDLIQVGLTFMVVPYIKEQKNRSGFSLLSELIKKSELTISKFNEGFDIILTKKPDKIKIGFIPALEIAEKTKSCRISFNIN